MIFLLIPTLWWTSIFTVVFGVSVEIVLCNFSDIFCAYRSGSLYYDARLKAV